MNGNESVNAERRIERIQRSMKRNVGTAGNKSTGTVNAGKIEINETGNGWGRNGNGKW